MPSILSWSAWVRALSNCYSTLTCHSLLTGLLLCALILLTGFQAWVSSKRQLPTEEGSISQTNTLIPTTALSSPQPLFPVHLLICLSACPSGLPSAVRQPRRRLDKGRHAQGHRVIGRLCALSFDGRPGASLLPDGDQACAGAQEARGVAAR